MRVSLSRRVAGTVVSCLLIAVLGTATGLSAAAEAAQSPQQAVDEGVAGASGDGVNQYVALVDRATGQLVASSGGDTQVISESIVKLFTVSYYLVQYNRNMPSAMAADLHEMIVHSNDRIESQYWTTAAVPAMAARYGLRHTANGPKTGPDDWGWEYITADDEANFLYRASKDPIVGPFLMDAMANVAPAGADGFDQHFGFNSLGGDHGSKQGWTDLNSTQAINIHSVGWTDKYFGAILETSDSPQYDTMRSDSTATADRVDSLKSPSQIAAEKATAQAVQVAQAAQAQQVAQAAVLSSTRAALAAAGSQMQMTITHLLREMGLLA